MLRVPSGVCLRRSGGRQDPRALARFLPPASEGLLDRFAQEALGLERVGNASLAEREPGEGFEGEQLDSESFHGVLVRGQDDASHHTE